MLCNLSPIVLCPIFFLPLGGSSFRRSLHRSPVPGSLVSSSSPLHRHVLLLLLHLGHVALLPRVLPLQKEEKNPATTGWVSGWLILVCFGLVNLLRGLYGG